MATGTALVRGFGRELPGDRGWPWKIYSRRNIFR